MIVPKSTSKIFQLTKTILDNRKEFLKFENDEVKKLNTLCLIAKGTIIKYDKGVKQINWVNSKTILETDHFWIGGNKYLERLKVKYPIIEEATIALCSEFDLERKDSESKLISYFDFLLFKQTNIETDSHVAEVSSVFIKDLNKTPPDWEVKLWIKGIWTYSSIQLPKHNITIRQPLNEDFEVVGKPLNDWMMPFLNNSMESCDSIIEFNYSKTTQARLEKFIEDLTITLSLFRLGSVQITRNEFSLNSILTPIQQKGSFERKANFYSYGLIREDNIKLGQFLNQIMNLLPPTRWKEENNKNNAIYISIDRYIEAVNKQQNIESKVTNIITCLEALFLKSQERSELTHKLSQRVAFLMQLFSNEAIKVYNNMKRAYDVRSTYIHGSMLLENDKKDLNEVSYNCLNYARLSIVIFLILSNKYDKEEILSKIDNAILDERARLKFANEITSMEILK